MCVHVDFVAPGMVRAFASLVLLNANMSLYEVM